MGQSYTQVTATSPLQEISCMRKISPTSEVKVSCRLSEEGVYVYTNNRAATYCNFPSAGPAFNTSEMAMDGSPLAKCGLSWPPLTAMPKP